MEWRMVGEWSRIFSIGAVGSVTAHLSRNKAKVPQPLKRTYALYMENDKESDNDQPLQGIDNVLASIHARYPAMEFLQYADKPEGSWHTLSGDSSTFQYSI
ncbi:uncharacterized protein EDB91DRAFT_1081207 [Suillus paluster]|uniref:uncharacterized protein n=1 Tax=Suillus paluster TaxID=48578 RepID=UPI001B8753B0|nr:uncharacterized protein EDB91DRAFT_1081207 [Suillus paluster]KAG1743268.1 hypothetical protein EDB91DRAFT_1081207 [Suillus paluster]